jgi:hypothetical protein
MERGFDFDLHPTLVSELPADAGWVVLAVPSNALSTGDWLGQLFKNHRAHLGVVTFTPGFQDRDKILKETGLSPAELVSASVPFLAQLDTNSSPQRLTSWRPPFSRVALAHGQKQRMQDLQKLFTQGGLPTHIQETFQKDLLIGDLLLRMLVAGLAKVQWNWNAYFDSPWPTHTIGATFEAIPIASRLRGIQEPNPWMVRGLKLILTPTSLRFVLRLIAALSPIPLEAFLASHFTKVDAQMRQGLVELSEVGGIDATSHSTKHIDILLAASH